MFGVVATVKVATPLASPIGDSREAVAGSEFYERLRRLRQKKICSGNQGGGYSYWFCMNYLARSFLVEPYTHIYMAFP